MTRRPAVGPLRLLMILPGIMGLLALAPTGSAAAPPAAAGAVPAAPPAAPAIAETSPAPATLRFYNREIVTFRAPYFGLEPAERALNGARRINDALAKGGPGEVKVASGAAGLTVAVDGVFVFRILGRDLDADDGETYDQAGIVVTRRLQEAVAAARHTMRGAELLWAVGRSAGATLGLCLIVWALARGRLWARKALAARLARRLRLGTQDQGMVLQTLRRFGQPVFLVLVAILFEEWLRFIFGLFPYTRPWEARLTRYIAGLLAQVLSAVFDALPGVGMVAVIFLLAYLFTQAVGTLARSVERGRLRLLGIDADVVHPTRRLVTAAIWLFALALAYPYLPGASSEAFKGLTVLVGLMVSLGASGIVGQAAGGFILTFSRALREGEWVRIGEVEGAVINVGPFSTRIRTPMDEEVSIPNTVVLSATTRNYSRPAAGEGALLETTVTIGYNVPWRQVHAMLLEAASRTPELDRDLPAQVLQAALSDFYVQYSLRVRLRDPSHRVPVLSGLNSHIQDVFNEYGVQIMSPHYLGDPAAPVLVPRERWYQPPAATSNCPNPRLDGERAKPGHEASREA